jgi:hypothetical protein
MKRAVRAAKYLAICGVLTAGGIGACSSDDSTTSNTNTNLPTDGGGSPDTGTSANSPDSGSGTTPSPDSGGGADTGTVQMSDDAGSPDTGSTGSPDTGTGAAADTGSPTDAGQDSAPAPSFCQTQAGLDFCDDFDLAGSLSVDGGAASAWTSIVSSGNEVSISSAQSSSPPNSLLVQLPDNDGGAGNGDQSAKVVKQVTPANGVTQAIYEFDMYIATVPLANTGGFATDFQFDDTAGGTDQFGFRIGVFANSTTGFDHADLEHNHPVLGGNDNIISPVPITAGAWNHVKMVVAYSGTSDDGGNGVAFQLYVNGSATAAVDETFPAPFAKAPFARFAAGMVYAFDPVNKDWGIYYDNFTLKLQ